MPHAVNDVLSVARIVEISNWSTEVYSLANLEAIQLRQDEVLGTQYSHIPNLWHWSKHHDDRCYMLLNLLHGEQFIALLPYNGSMHGGSFLFHLSLDFNKASKSSCSGHPFYFLFPGWFGCLNLNTCSLSAALLSMYAISRYDTALLQEMNATTNNNASSPCTMAITKELHRKIRYNYFTLI